MILDLLLDCSRLDEDGKVLTPEELLYRVSKLPCPLQSPL